jgi:hypothetical protein
MSQMVRQIKMPPIAWPRAGQHHKLTWWPMHPRSAKTCGSKPLYMWWCCISGVQSGTGGTITDVNCNETCRAMLISWRICVTKSCRLRLSFDWSALEAHSQQKTGTTSTTCEQKPSQSLGGLCICTWIYIVLRIKLMWVVSTEPSLIGGFPERCLLNSFFCYLLITDKCFRVPVVH